LIFNRIPSHVTSSRLIGHVTICFPHRPFPIDGTLEPRLYLLTVSDIFNGECNAIVYVTLNDLQTRVNVIPFGTNRFLTYDFQ